MGKQPMVLIDRKRKETHRTATLYNKSSKEKAYAVDYNAAFEESIAEKNKLIGQWLNKAGAEIVLQIGSKEQEQEFFNS